jgi:hypothetical protein
VGSGSTTVDLKNAGSIPKVKATPAITAVEAEIQY